MYAAGTAISSGLLFQFSIGGCLEESASGILGFVHQCRDASAGVIDPGAFALVGAAFFGGVPAHSTLDRDNARTTNDGAYLLPIMVSTLTSKFIADFFTHSLYHSLIEVKSYPFIDTALAYEKV